MHRSSFGQDILSAHASPDPLVSSYKFNQTMPKNGKDNESDRDDDKGMKVQTYQFNPAPKEEYNDWSKSHQNQALLCHLKSA